MNRYKSLLSEVDAPPTNPGQVISDELEKVKGKTDDDSKRREKALTDIQKDPDKLDDYEKKEGTPEGDAATVVAAAQKQSIAQAPKTEGRIRRYVSVLAEAAPNDQIAAAVKAELDKGSDPEEISIGKDKVVIKHADNTPFKKGDKTDDIQVFAPGDGSLLGAMKPPASKPAEQDPAPKEEKPAEKETESVPANEPEEDVEVEKAQYNTSEARKQQKITAPLYDNLGKHLIISLEVLDELYSYGDVNLNKEERQLLRSYVEKMNAFRKEVQSFNKEMSRVHNTIRDKNIYKLYKATLKKLGGLE